MDDAKHAEYVTAVEMAVQEANKALGAGLGVVSWIDGRDRPDVGAECAILIHAGLCAGIRGTFEECVCWLDREIRQRLMRQNDPENPAGWL